MAAGFSTWPLAFPDVNSWPRITVVTPSFNQAQFLSTTLRSVLGQNYPNLEYIVMDGGSTDGSAEVIRAHAGALTHWESARDAGQADALNRGFARATGDILCWLNSDDFHLPETLWRVAALLRERLQEPRIIYGQCLTFEDDGAKTGVAPAYTHDAERLRRCDYLTQPSTFWTAAAWGAVGPLNAALHFAFDWEWFLRALPVCHFETVAPVLSAYRRHAAHKSGTGGETRRDEIEAVMQAHSSAETLAMFRWLRAHLELWPALRQWRSYRWHGLPTPLVRAVIPRLWLRAPGWNRDHLIDCFNML